MKNRIEVLVGKLIVNEIPERSWMYLIIDFIIKLSLVVRKNTVLVVCNKLLKMAYFIITTEGISAERLARLFKVNI